MKSINYFLKLYISLIIPTHGEVDQMFNKTYSE